ncbi:MAG: hypothetical protein ACRDRV_03775 [Pseudonocardiaceae bacterium]
MAVVAVLVAGLLWWCPWCTVRVTDGSDLLDDELELVESLIRKENDRVTNSGQEWVSVAVMLPIHPEAEPTAPVRIIHQLQGSYLGQYWFNHPSGDDSQFGSDRPLIRLLIADTGYRGEDWPDTVAQLVDMARPGSDARLVAVTGLDQSTTATQAAVNELARHQIPMIGSLITATDLAAEGLFRVTPTNSDEALAMIRYLQQRDDWKLASAAQPYTAYRIQDRARADTYAQDLGKKYNEAFPRDQAHILSPIPGEFDSRKPAAGNALRSEVSVICADHPTVVFFAGRSGDLRTFLRHLSGRSQPCADTPITVVTGDAASDLSAQRNNPQKNLPLWGDGANVTVYYTTLASPLAWKDEYSEYISSEVVTRFVEGNRSYQALFPNDPLEDGQAIMSHDAVITAATAAGNAISQQDQRPVPEALSNGLFQIKGNGKVSGASGFIDFQNDEDLPDGVPYNKTIPIMRLLPDGTTTLVGLSSRLGTPPR